MSIYCGILDKDGMDSLALKSGEAFKQFFQRANKNNGCYFEVNLSPSQVDIFRELNENKNSGFDPKNSSDMATKALLQFGGEDITIPADHVDLWKEITGRIDSGSRDKTKS
tara:strand:+ start:940 stop:1272 length:333 start_codon:yes stop_codon:yes gene_type:complete